MMHKAALVKWSKHSIFAHLRRIVHIQLSDEEMRYDNSFFLKKNLKRHIYKNRGSIKDNAETYCLQSRTNCRYCDQSIN
jgi:hypothetical protein